MGRGATADVYRGWDTRLDRRVAVKVARAGSDLPNGSAEMTAEARRMALLAHPGLVAVHDLGVVDGRPFVVMDLVDGSTLSALLAERPERRLALEDVRALAADLADALQPCTPRGSSTATSSPPTSWSSRTGTGCTRA
jgi:serine/threonine protein kinase